MRTMTITVQRADSATAYVLSEEACQALFTCIAVGDAHARPERHRGGVQIASFYARAFARASETAAVMDELCRALGLFEYDLDLEKDVAQYNRDLMRRGGDPGDDEGPDAS